MYSYRSFVLEQEGGHRTGKIGFKMLELGYENFGPTQTHNTQTPALTRQSQKPATTT